MKADKLQVNIYDTRAAMGAAAALDIKNKFCELLATKPQINVIFAAAPSQNEVLASLVADKDIDWSRINAYHMDEYIGLAADARPEKDAMVLQYNNLLDENKDYFDMVYDQASHCIDKNKPNCSRRELLGPDKIHPNSEGGQIVADNFDLNIFKA